MFWRIKIILQEIIYTIFIFIGEIFILTKMYRIAEVLYKLGSRIWRAKQAEILSCLGSLYERTNNLEKAAESYKEACVLEPNDGFHYIELGSIYEKQNRISIAIESYEKALQIGVNFGGAFRDEIQSKINRLKASKGDGSI